MYVLIGIRYSFTSTSKHFNTVISQVSGGYVIGLGVYYIYVCIQFFF